MRKNLCDFCYCFSIITSLPYLHAIAFTGHPLTHIPPVTAAEVAAILKSIPSKSSPMDFIATSLIKSCHGVFSELISRLANLSFNEGRFPSRFKTAQITPLLKKTGLDKSSPENYRPISNLNNISKILERLFLNRIRSHVTSCSNFNPFQSAYRSKHSTETALVYTVNNICRSANEGNCTLLISLDLSAAFDTVDHNLLIARFDDSFGIRGNFLSWIDSYITNRSQFVRIGRFSSKNTYCTCGVPQGSVLGPILFNIYTSPIASIAESYNTRQQQYADDTQLYIALSAQSLSQSLLSLENCLSHLRAWFCHNGLALNPDKTDAVLFGTRNKLGSLSTLTHVDVAGTSVQLSKKVKILGATLDQQLTFHDHVNTVCSASFYHLRSFRHVRPALTQDIAKALGSAVIGTKLDYANSILHGTSSANIKRLQRVQNALARVVLSSPSPSATKNLQRLHWLPVQYRIRYEVCSLAYQPYTSTAPSYLSSTVSHYLPTRSLRSTDTQLLTVPRSRLVFADRGFYIAGPTEWNNLPLTVRSANSLGIFHSRLKTHLYRLALNEP